MSFKGKIWQLTTEQILLLFKGRLTSIYCEDPFIEKIILNLADYKSKGYNIIFGDDVSESFIRNDLLQNNLFFSSSSYLILNSELIPNELIELLSSNSELLEEKKIILFFQKQKKTFLTVDGFKIEVVAPYFYEEDKLLDFLSSKMHLNLTYRVRQLILENIPHNTESFILILKKISLSNNPSDIEAIRNMIKNEYFNPFDLITSLMNKNEKYFFESIIDKDLNTGQLLLLVNQTFNFILKVLGGSELLINKKKLTSYDKKIITYSKDWSYQELKTLICRIQRLETLAKLDISKAKNYCQINSL